MFETMRPALDVGNAVIMALDNQLSDSEIINIGSGIGTSVMEIAETLKKIYGSDSEIKITGDFRIGDIARNRADISKAQKIFGFRQTIGLKEGLNAFCSWILE